MKKTSQKVSRRAGYGLTVALLVTVGMVVKFGIGSRLKAEEPKPFLAATTKTTKLEADTLLDSKDVILTLKSDKNRLVKVPDNEAFKLAIVDGETDLVIDTPKNFSEKDLLKELLKDNEETKDGENTEEVTKTSDSETLQEQTSTYRATDKNSSSLEATTQSTSEEKIAPEITKETIEESFNAGDFRISDIEGKSPEEIISTMSSLFYGIKDNKGFTYITLLADKPLKIVAHHTKLAEKVALDVIDVENDEKQTLFTFNPSKEDVEDLMIYNVLKGSEGEQLGTSEDAEQPAGDEKIEVGTTDLKGTVRVTAESSKAKYIETISTWNGATVDVSKEAEYIVKDQKAPQLKAELQQYGVLKDNSSYAGLEVEFNFKKDQFNWFNTLEEAKQHGVVTAYYTKLLKETEGKSLVDFILPFQLKTNTLGVKDENDNPNVFYTVGRTIDKDEKVLTTYPTKEMGNFNPTEYNPQDGKMVKNQQPENTYGDTLFIAEKKDNETVVDDSINQTGLRFTDRDVSVVLSTKENYIEVGNDDSAVVGKTDSDGKPMRLDDIHYSVRSTVKSPSNGYPGSLTMIVLPRQGDGRGSTFTGSYSLVDLKAVAQTRPGGNVDNDINVYYTTSTTVTPSTNPTSVDPGYGGSVGTGIWKTFNGTKVDNVTAVILMSMKFFPYDAPTTKGMDFTVVPVGGGLNDTFVADATLVAKEPTISLLHKSNKTNVIRENRRLSGYAWFDDNLNGLKDAGEEGFEGVPVKLFRKSNDFHETSFTLLTKDLQGNNLANLKTDEHGYFGAYRLPEGTYKLEFLIGNEYKSTIQDTEEASQTVNTSKIGPIEETAGTAHTTEYIQPPLGAFDPPTNDIYNVNAGIIRKGTINVYKYIDGMITDANQDYQPDNPSDVNDDGSLVNHAAALPGAVFELRDVVTDAITGEVLSSTKIDDDTTNGDGYVGFKRFPVEDEKNGNGMVIKKHHYKIVEVKPPTGYELHGKEIDATIKTGNQKVNLYVPNKAQTKLPFTGSTDIMQGILIVAGSMFLIALFFVGVKLFQFDDGYNKMK